MKNFKAPELQTDEKQPPKHETEKPIDWRMQMGGSDRSIRIHVHEKNIAQRG